MDADQQLAAGVLLLFLVIIVIYSWLIAPGLNARRIKRIYWYGFVSALGGRLGSINWIGKETSGSGGSVNPLDWLTLLAGGVILILVNFFLQPSAIHLPTSLKISSPCRP